MNKVASLLFAGALVLGAANQSQIFTGVITDTMCGADHKATKIAPESRCVRDCAKTGAKYALYDGRNVYTLSDQQTAEKFAARKVRVRGVRHTQDLTDGETSAAHRRDGQRTLIRLDLVPGRPVFPRHDPLGDLPQIAKGLNAAFASGRQPGLAMVVCAAELQLEADLDDPARGASPPCSNEKTRRVRGPHSFAKEEASSSKRMSVPPCLSLKRAAASFVAKARMPGEQRSYWTGWGSFSASIRGCCRAHMLTSLPRTTYACSGLNFAPVP